MENKTTEAQRRAIYKYDDTFERVNCRFSKGTKERIKKIGYKSINTFIISAVMEKLEKGLKNNPDESRRKEMEALMKTIDEDDNNYIFIGKLKAKFGNAAKK